MKNHPNFHAKTNFAFITDACLFVKLDMRQVMTWDPASKPHSSAMNTEIMCCKLTLCPTLVEARRRISKCV